uniref:Uncharacterized protein n=1 Tax=Strongyloides venezuelensis TaxID=75913 RepID=A0A0K0G560_STRVS
MLQPKYFFTPVLICIFLHLLVIIGTEQHTFSLFSGINHKVIDAINIAIAIIDIILITLYIANFKFLRPHTKIIYFLILLCGVIITLYSCTCFIAIIFIKKIKLDAFTLICFTLQCIMLITHIGLLFKNSCSELETNVPKKSFMESLQNENSNSNP